MQADILTAFFLDLRQKVDRIGLQRCDIRVCVERVNTPGRMPAGPCGQNRAFDKTYVFPAHFRQVIENGRSDDAATDHNNPVIRLHS